MANYQTHVSFGAAAGVAVAAAGTVWLPETGIQAGMLVVFFGFIGGMIPDLDHDTGLALTTIGAMLSTFVPVIALFMLAPDKTKVTSIVFFIILPCHFILHWLARQFPLWEKRHGLWDAIKAIGIAGLCALPVMVLLKFVPFGWGRTTQGYLKLWGCMIGVAALIQFLIPLFKVMTVHRGVFHTVPAIIIYTEIIFLLMYNQGIKERILITVGAFAGSLSHLLLDEIYSVDFEGRRLKRSFGTALSFWKSDYPYSSTLAYISVIVLGLCCYVTQPYFQG